MQNFILDTDSYKMSHFLGYPAGTEHIYSYAESRGGVYPATVFFGLQVFIKYLAQVRITDENIREAQAFAKDHGVPFNLSGWITIKNKYKGKIPVIIKAVPEGTLVPTGNVLVTVENTDPTMPWLTSYIETALLRACWYPTTIATRIFYMKKAIKPYYDRTSDSANMDFAILDFSPRGVSSYETAEIGGLAHLLHFRGSDNIPAILAAHKYYDEPMAGFSVAATEHSVMTAYTQECEYFSFDRLIDTMMPEGGTLSVVSDTWNVYHAAHMWVALASKIRAKNGTLVFRPDSGEMKDVLPRVLNTLMDGFGYDTNKKGFRVLRNVKILWGDGINENSVGHPFQIAESLGISADSIMVGSGGGLMQANVDRDTCKFAFKASNATINGRDVEIAKDPITDPGKRSKLGRLQLVYNILSGSLATIPENANTFFPVTNLLKIVYELSAIESDLAYDTFETIRERVNEFI